MKLTKEWIETWFNEFNRLYFGEELPMPLLYVSHARQRLGCLRYKYNKVARAREAFDYRLGISNYYLLTEWDYQNILLHEMIHLLIAHRKLKDTSAHGPIFRSIRDRLNQQCGWQVQISVNTSQLSVNPQYIQRKRYLVLAITTDDGKNFFSVVNRRYAAQIKAQLRHTKAVREQAWYVTDDAYFADFPMVRTARGRFVEADEFHKKIAQLQSGGLFSSEVSLS